MKINKYNATHNTSIRKVKPSYIAIHYTAGIKSTKGQAKNICHYFSTTKNQASADFVVDDAEIWQYNKDIKGRYCWAVGGKKQPTKGGPYYGKATNSNTISIEICSTNTTGKVQSPNSSGWKFTQKALDQAELLIKYLMVEYNIDSAHIIRHYDVNGKLCPGISGWNKETNEKAWKSFLQRFTSKLATVTAADGLNMRKTMSSKTDANIICKIPYQEKVSYTSKGTTWTKVTYNGKSGYVYNKYLAF